MPSERRYSTDSHGNKILKSYKGKKEVFVVPDDVKEISSTAFMGNHYIRKVIIPDTVEHIGSSAFEHCNNLEEVVLPKGMKNIPSCLFLNCISLHKVNIPEEAKTIERSAFMFCDSLEEILISDNVKTIGKMAFQYCRNLKTVVLPDGLREIGDVAFSGCLSLTDIEVPENVETIGDSAFSNCRSLKKLTVPGSCKFYTNSLYGCDSLERFYSKYLPVGYSVFVYNPATAEEKAIIFSAAIGMFEKYDKNKQDTLTEYLNRNTEKVIKRLVSKRNSYAIENIYNYSLLSAEKCTELLAEIEDCEIRTFVLEYMDKKGITRQDFSL